MSMTDPIADLLTRIRNSQMAKHKTVGVPASRIKLAILKILEEEGYIDGFESVESAGPTRMLQVRLRYTSAGQKSITGVERVSRPGRRVYCKKDEIPKVLDGLGISILSTPKGVLTGTSCRRLGVGGEILCNVW